MAGPTTPADTAPGPAAGATAAQVMRGAWRREWRYLRASPVDLAVFTWIPLLVFGLIIATFWQGVPRELPVAVVDLDHSALSQQVARQVDATPTARVAAFAPDLSAAMALVRQRRAIGILYLPPHLERDVTAGHRTGVQYLSNAQFSTAAGTVAADVQRAVGTLSAQATALARLKRGEAPLPVADSTPPVDVRIISLYNGDMDYELFLGGSLVPALLQLLIVVAAVSALGREFRDGTVPGWLGPEPARTVWPALLGKLAPGCCIWLAWAALFLFFFALWRNHPVQGSVTLVAVGLVVFVLVHLAYGAMIAALAGNMRFALSAAGFIAGPAFAFAGQTFPLLGTTLFAWLWSTLLPLRYWLQLQNQQWVMGAPVAVSLPPLAILLGFVAVGAWLARWGTLRMAASPQRWGQR